MVIIQHLIAITLALIIDRMIGDPSTWPHPVRWLGSFITWLERLLNKGSFRKTKGMFLLLIIVIASLLMTSVCVWVFYQFHILAGIVVEAIIISLTISQHDLKNAALKVYNPLNNRDIKGARKQVSMIVGRDTKELNEDGITRATVETVAENISDGTSAPLFWALIGGAPLAMVYRAVNTCDSMVGYKNNRYGEFGTASARFDDVVSWLPSRITGFCMIISNSPSFMTKRQALLGLRREANKHISPNSGWGEAAAALLLGVQLGGISYYEGIKSERAVMGKNRVNLRKEHIVDSLRIVDRTIGLFFILSWLVGGIYAATITWI